ncbi:DNA phosphorothioation-dependent restriction protein DptH [Alkalihalophilus pseudofirmus]|uniref:DNA phosphorothioation-dependent restriction protein DptH n=1 Tax=Alkalihalophilus pseudofirmus TaxID=79885 RepID=A0AAJ2NMQ5_ALKPS|nr:DNA phosphorothioation-dependent restriction protein DptH [Alkalihalophilus pseudofirmus]MDV2884690.1 DNA phosphorothioation-dependent restriction protein DptH [Alkalihalophilus pseudofirmus]
MSNQFYKYVSEILVDYFADYNPSNGDRYYLQLDNHDEVLHLVESLLNSSFAHPFTFKHSLGEEYKTFYIELKGLKLVIAYTSPEVKPDFLVTLRNQVGEQEGSWNNTALLSIVSEQLDSIQGGSSDLQKEGMPLHPNSLFKRLKNEIENSVLSKNEQIILMDNLKHLMEDHALLQVTLLDFEDIFSVLSKGSLEDKDYNSFGLFKDEDISSYTGSKLKDRLARNRELFDYVKKAHDFGSLEDDLDKQFTSRGIQELKNENWNEVPFQNVLRSAEEKINETKNTKVTLKDLHVVEKLVYWDKPASDTAAGRRKKHMVIFNPSKKEEIEVNISYEIIGGENKSLSKDYFTISKSVLVSLEVKRLSASIKINALKDSPTFVRVNYKHEGKASLGNEFHIAVLPFEESIINEIKTRYSVNVKKQCLELESDVDELIFGQGIGYEEIDISQSNENFKLPLDTKVKITPQADAFDENDCLIFNIEYEGCFFPILMKNNLPESVPITAMRLWRMKRELGKSFQKDKNRLLIGNREYYIHSEYKQFLEWEEFWVQEGVYAATLDAEEILPERIELDEDLREAYSRYIQYFRIHKTTPTLAFIDENYKERALVYIKQYLHQIKLFEEGKAPGSKGRNLLQLGMLKSGKDIYLTPFHPLVIVYQLLITEELRNEEIDSSILNRLKPDALLPFLYHNKDQLYKPDNQSAALEWIIYKPVKEVTVSDASQYLGKVVQDKINQFEEHFDFLFINESKAPLKLNVVNITNDKEVLVGIVNWLIKRINKEGYEQVKPVEVTIYQEKIQQSAFDQFSRLEDSDSIKEYLNGVSFKSTKYDENDLIRFIRENLFYYKQKITKEYKYAHISFYKMQSQENYAIQKMSDMKTGISLSGLVTTVPSMKGEEDFRSGFGIKGAEIQSSLLLETAYYTNELAANMKNDGSDTYLKGVSIVSRTVNEDEETLEKIFKSSYWITFIDPSVDLSFFQNYNQNLVVIHYNDQYTSSSRYDAITVTDKSEQFNHVIKEYLNSKGVESDQESVNNTIQAFNTFNGEWLLRIVGSKGHFTREKLSIISAIKYSLSYFEHRNILWVPVSLEEILRVAGAVHLNRKDGIFTAKNLNVKGSHSDDLLLIGMERSDEGLKLHYYPVEVKIGINSAQVFEKARTQIKNTRKLFDSYLQKNINGTTSFQNIFYRNFFAQLFISNATRLEQGGFWSEKNYSLTDGEVQCLLNDNYEVSTELKTLVGEGAILSFQKDAYHRTAALEDNVMLLNLTEEDGFRGITEPIQHLVDRIKEGKTDFEKEKLLDFNYKFKREHEHKNVAEPPDESGYNIGSKTPNKTGETEEAASLKLTSKPPKLEDIRILIGKAENSTKDIYWEYGNKGLANRHLLISGKSGQGKTYFMQCLLLEKAKNGLSSIVIDYTEGFLPNQLETEFTEALGDNLKQQIVYTDKFPINPFKKNERDIGGLTLPESETDVAERIKSVFSSVYSTLGIQQLNAIYEATLAGVQKYGESMDLEKLKVELEEDGSSYAKTALSQIRSLIDRNPFEPLNPLDWNEIINAKGTVFVIQLTGYPRDVQLMITEFILWDLWSYSVRNGNKNIPMPVVMDEAQNLDHTEKSPSARVLTEGRKFGWSAWYATQFLKSQLDADELARLQNASQKIYFSPPEQEISTIASSLAQNPTEKKEWENKLSNLKKGQCIVHGPTLDQKGELTKPIVTIVNITALHERK